MLDRNRIGATSTSNHKCSSDFYWMAVTTKELKIKLGIKLPGRA